MIPMGILTDCGAVLLGSLIGTKVKHIPEKLREYMTVLFGICAIAIGINSTIKVDNMTAVVLAVLAGFGLGQVLELEERLKGWLQNILAPIQKDGEGVQGELYMTVVALFCFSGFGWYGTLVESISGSPDILQSKAVLDFCTALMFSAILGRAVCQIPLGQVVVMVAVFGLGKLLMPIMSPSVFADFCACGGILTMATGFRLSGIKSIPIINMMLALLLVIPFSMLL